MCSTRRRATHIFNFLNKGAPGGGSTISADAIDMSNVNLAKGYDYNALILATPDGANAFDPRYGQPDLWQAGHAGTVQREVHLLGSLDQQPVRPGGSLRAPPFLSRRAFRLSDIARHPEVTNRASPRH